MSESLLTKGIEKVIWIIAMVIVAGLSSLVTLWIQDRTPEIVVRQYYNTVDTRTSVPKQVGELVLDYKQQVTGKKSVYLLEVANEGRGPEEDLRVQAQFPDNIKLAFDVIPNLRVYKPDSVSLNNDGFFMSLKGFPKKALASIAFVPPENEKLLCEIKIKAAGKLEEGKVQAIEGVECD